jgi:DNA-directed RNA polymerase specialized sigma24 family protein
MVPPNRSMDDEQEKRLRAALESLPDEMRRCSFLRFVQGFEENEIAVLMKMPLERVRMHLYQVQKRLHLVIACPPARLDGDDEEIS